MKVQLNTVEDVERFVGDDPLLIASIKQAVARGFESSYIKPIANCKEVNAIKKEWTDNFQSGKFITKDLIQEAFCHAIETDVNALLEDKDFVRETVNNCIISSFNLDDFRLRQTISRLLNNLLNRAK